MKKVLKKILSLALTVLTIAGCFALLPGNTKTVYAATVTSGECGDNLTWTFEDGTLTISGTGAMWDITYDENEGEYIYPDGWYDELENDITKIVISDGATSIGDYAFDEFSYVTNVNIPNSVTHIGDYAFSSMYGFTDDSGWDSVTVSVNIPDGVTYIGDGAFAYSNLSGDLAIPDSVQTIGDGAFSSCGAETISIGASVSSIGEMAFCEYLGDSDYDTGSLTAINVDSDNNYYSSVDGVLFNKAGTTLIYYPNGKSATSYEVPKGVATIVTYAFDWCAVLKTITLPSSLSTVEEEAFDYCYNLKTVNYNGTKTDWSKISIAKNIVFSEDGETITVPTNTPLFDATMVYNSSSDNSDSSTPTLKITASALNVRKGAGTSYGIITSVKKGKVYPYTATKKVGNVTWYKITVNSKTSGWVSGKYIKVVSTGSSSDTSAETSENTIKITASALNVRKGAGTKYGIITSVKKGGVYPYTATKKVGNVTWYKIKVNNKTSGWVSGVYAKPVVSKIKVTGGTVNVRKGAGTGYRVLTVVKKGNTYTCTDTKTIKGVTWYKIKVNNSITGWISGKYAKAA